MSQQPRACRVARSLVAFLVGFAAILGTGWASAAPAAADTPLITVQMSSLTPSSTTGDGTLKITGRITNTSGEDLRSVQVYLWRDMTPLVTQEQFSAYLASVVTLPVGARAVDREHAVWQAVTSTDKPVFAPGQSAAFSVSAPIKLLGFTTQGLYPVGVQVRAQVPDGSTLTAGRSRSVLPVLLTSTKLSYTPLVILTSRPSLLGPAAFADDHLVADLSGRLSQLLDRASQPGSTALVDPSLVDEAEALTTAHTVDGRTPAASDLQRQAQVAGDWLTKLRGVLAAHPSYRLPYGDPNLTPLVVAGDTSTRDRIAASLTPDNPVANLPLAVFTDTVTPALLSFVQPWKPAVVIGAGVSDGVDPMTGIAVKDVALGITAGGPPPPPTNTPVQVRQRAMAQALLASGSGSPMLLPIGSQADLRLDQLIRPALTATPLDLTLAASALVSGSESRPDPSAWEQLRDLALERFSAWGEVTGLNAEATSRADRALARSLSSSFTTSQGAQFLTSATALVGDVLGSQAIRLALAGEFVLSSATNSLPATITNTLDQAVTVKVSFVSENPQRVRVPDTADITVPAGETVTAEFSPHAYTNGSVNVTARLETPQGRPIGPPQQITLRATSFGRIGWIIVILSGVVFMGATAMRIRQVQHEHAREQAATPPPSVSFPEGSPGGQTGVPTGSTLGDAATTPAHPDGSDSR